MPLLNRHDVLTHLYKHNSTFNMKAFDFYPIFKHLNFDMNLSNRELCIEWKKNIFLIHLEM